MHKGTPHRPQMPGFLFTLKSDDICYILKLEYKKGGYLMKRNIKSLLAMLLAVVLVLGMTPATASAARRKPTPGRVALTGISAPSYNKITVKWKQASNATHYKIYYKKAGTRKWMGVATVQGNKTSYTHTSSRKRPITPGQKYTYTVKAYNSKYKTYGRYNTKGLTTRTKPSAVRLKRAALSKDKKSISITWNRASGCNNYCIYRRTPSTKWKRIANVRVPRTSYVDRSPVKGQKNIYTVRSYYSPTKIYGNYNTRGLTVSVPKSGSSSSRKITPGTVSLSKISAPAYNKINIQWKKASNATHYKIYYKKEGTSKWTGVATVAGSTTSYTHISSKTKPITVGQRYSYTVKAYNSKYKTYGRYSSKGLTANTKPSTVKLKNALLSRNKKSVTISWNRASGCNQYLVYRKNPFSGWKRIATLKNTVTSYTDQAPVRGTTNTYTVKGYYSPTKTSGRYNTSGCSVFVPKSGADTTSKYTYEVKIINTYNEFYNTANTAPFFYIKTNNPNGDSIRLNWSPDPEGLTENVISTGYYRDLKGTQVGNMQKVQGGYVCQFYPQKTGFYTVLVREIKPQFLDNPLYADSSLYYCYETNASVTVTIKDYKKTGVEWINGLIKKYTKPGMTPKEKFEAVIYGEFVNGSRYRYPTTIKGEQGYAFMLKEQGAMWQNHQLNSSTSPGLLCDIGNIIGYPVKRVSYDLSHPDHDAVVDSSGKYYSICPPVYTGQIDKEDIEYIDFSKY